MSTLVLLLASQLAAALAASPLATEYTIDERQRGREFLGYAAQPRAQSTRFDWLLPSPPVA